VENNIVSLCSTCHNKLHYGKDIREDLYKLYKDREKLLTIAGIKITFEELFKMYN
jgi:5-methylcytosine-specific restriction protein A